MLRLDCQRIPTGDLVHFSISRTIDQSSGYQGQAFHFPMVVLIGYSIRLYRESRVKTSNAMNLSDIHISSGKRHFGVVRYFTVSSAQLCGF
jgi:hypothetical protein